MVAVALLLGGPQVLAQSWPAKTVRIVVPFAPGGTADTLGRLVSQRLSETLKENFIVENRAGAGGVIGSDLGAKACGAQSSRAAAANAAALGAERRASCERDAATGRHFTRASR